MVLHQRRLSWLTPVTSSTPEIPKIDDLLGVQFVVMRAGYDHPFIPNGYVVLAIMALCHVTQLGKHRNHRLPLDVVAEWVSKYLDHCVLVVGAQMRGIWGQSHDRPSVIGVGRRWESTRNQGITSHLLAFQELLCVRFLCWSEGRAVR
jgi:hypothetical protein